ncbi:fluoride efflux transporter FluC [Microbacterium hydrocarbonoxydans]|uniref:fluoride efflux transporter FluC n=1 Tax=Microbacterium hydrocarbonoxydans TaxID=273678 RepID=UPI00204094BC|nr:CrcB family protein [Microbacterium hydrocarbonoxydans]MCM3778208.1 CrcB family protein [Microbacterium hydrocarbonoxydans]
MTPRRVLLVFVGGAVGTAGRLALGLWIADAGGFPIATFVVNVVGALLIGVLAARMPQSTDLRVLLGTGVLGGFTTYSAFMTGTVELWSATPALAAVYAVGSLVLGLAAAALGLRLGRPRGTARPAEAAS